MIHSVKINATGGILSPDKLQKIAISAQKSGLDLISFGSRQEVLISCPTTQVHEFSTLLGQEKIDMQLDVSEFPNIISSYPSEGIFSSDYWLSEGIYKDVFDSFDFRPSLKVNIVDNDQCLVPFFTGNVNFVASSQHHFWFLYIKTDYDEKTILFPKLVYSTDIGKVVKIIEQEWTNIFLNDIQDALKKIVLGFPNCQSIQKDLELPPFRFPYFEGINPYGDNFWIGIYRRNQEFPLAFLIDLCDLCSKTQIGQICVTPWKTLIIKGIKKVDRVFWEKLLGKHGINVRHASLELNWLLPDFDSLALQTKEYVVNHFNKKDIRTFGLVFGVQTENKHTNPSSVVIEEKTLFKAGILDFLNTYDVKYSENFNINSASFTYFKKNVSKIALPNVLADLCKLYYNTLENVSIVQKADNPTPNSTKTNNSYNVYQCKHCLTIYDPKLGEEETNIEKNTSFEQLPDAYICFTCDAPKSDFEKKKWDEVLI